MGRYDRESNTYILLAFLHHSFPIVIEGSLFRHIMANVKMKWGALHGYTFSLQLSCFGQVNIGSFQILLKHTKFSFYILVMKLVPVNDYKIG